MSYVPRRIQTIKKDGKTDTISDQEFSALEAPLVLLGEPGAGKTETAHAISEARHSPALTSQQSRIDGPDELQASSAEQPLVAILKRLKDLGVRSFAVTCRATDWASVQNERTIETWFTERLVVGLFQPSA